MESGCRGCVPPSRPWGPVLHPFQLPMPHHFLACGHVTLISASSVTRPCLSVYIQIPLSLSGSACTTPKLPIQGWNPSHGSDNTGSLTGCATRELLEAVSCFKTLQIPNLSNSRHAFPLHSFLSYHQSTYITEF